MGEKPAFGDAALHSFSASAWTEGKHHLATVGILLPLALTAAPQVWFCPLDPLVRPEVGYGGSLQYMSLFTPKRPVDTGCFSSQRIQNLSPVDQLSHR
jgi:hypothetical protein